MSFYWSYSPVCLRILWFISHLSHSSKLKWYLTIRWFRTITIFKITKNELAKLFRILHTKKKNQVYHLKNNTTYDWNYCQGSILNGEIGSNPIGYEMIAMGPDCNVNSILKKRRFFKSQKLTPFALWASFWSNYCYPDENHS